MQTAPQSANDIETHRIRVLNRTQHERLACMNQAARTLRRMGYRVIREALAGGRAATPLIEIERGKESSIGPLLDRACTRWWRANDGGKRGFADFMSVTVSWQETSVGATISECSVTGGL